jgi:thiol-disulfide isomerase/thioredoxin
MLHVDVYSKHNCPLCDHGVEMMKELQKEIPFELSVIDIYEDDELLLKYQVMIPVVAVTEEEIDFGQLSKEKIRKRLLQIIG